MTWHRSRPYAKTRLWADREKTEYFHVYVFRDREAMLQFWRQRPGQCAGEAEDFLAWCGTWTTTHVGRRLAPRTRSCGEILFFLDSVRVGIVAHEMVHAALSHVCGDASVDRKAKWTRQMTVEEFLHSEHNERLAYVAGDLVRQFWVWWYRMTLTTP